MNEQHTFDSLWDRLVLLHAEYYQFYYHTGHDSVYSPELSSLWTEISNSLPSYFRNGKLATSSLALNFLQAKIAELERSSVTHEKITSERQNQRREQYLASAGYSRGDVILGHLELFHDMGMDLPEYAVEDPTRSGYDAIYLIRTGDHLVTYHHDGSVAFEGMIDFDPETRSAPLRQDRPYGLITRGSSFFINQSMTFSTWENFFHVNPAMKARLTIYPERL